MRTLLLFAALLGYDATLAFAEDKPIRNVLITLEDGSQILIESPAVQTVAPKTYKLVPAKSPVTYSAAPVVFAPSPVVYSAPVVRVPIAAPVLYYQAVPAQRTTVYRGPLGRVRKVVVE